MRRTEIEMKKNFLLMGLTLRVEDFVTIEQVVEQQLWGFLSEGVETIVETFFWSTLLFSKAYTPTLFASWVSFLLPIWLCEISTKWAFWLTPSKRSTLYTSSILGMRLPNWNQVTSEFRCLWNKQ